MPRQRHLRRGLHDGESGVRMPVIQRLFILAVALAPFAARAESLIPSTGDPVRCVVIAGNQTSLLSAQSTFLVPNVPADRPIRVQIVCDDAERGMTAATGQEVPAVPNGITEIN